MKVTPIVASRFASDGGTSYGPVPKPIWSKLTPPDDENRIAVTANCLFVELDDGQKGLIDTGCGAPDKYTEKEQAIHGLSGDWLLQQELNRLKTPMDKLDFVIFTHLHWDHAGGAGRRASNGTIVPSFPNARYYVHAHEWRLATSEKPLLHRSTYSATTLSPFKQMEDEFYLMLVEDNASEILPGISLVRSGGHTDGHSVVVLQSDRLMLHHPDSKKLPQLHTVLFAGDVCPTRHHLRMFYQLSFDTFPLDTRAWKQRWLPQLAEEKALLFFAHDPELFGCTIQPDGREEWLPETTLQVPC